MLFGIQIQANMLVVGGVVLAALTVLQILVGLRKIRFKGKAHMQVHKALAWLMLLGAIAHGLLASVFLNLI